MLAVFLSAVEATIVATALPTIIGDLGGFELYSWVFAAYLLAQGAFIPIFGRLADIYGRKPVFIVATSLFLVGTFLCGRAASMEQLIIFRALKGLGAAGVQPITQTIIGDLYTLHERARIQGLLSSVWGISAVAGPALGGVIINFFSWHWVFYLNIPFGIIAILGISFFFHEDAAHKKSYIDFGGAVLLVATVVSLLVFLVQGGSAWAWNSGPSLILVAVFLAGGVLFYYWEQRVPEPIFPFEILKNRTILACDLAVFFAGALTVGLSSTIPNFVQGVAGTSATVAGLTLGAMSLGWPLASTFSVRLILKWGFRYTAAGGTVFTVISSLMLLNLGIQTSPWSVALAVFTMGLGMGLTVTTYIVAVQGAVSWEKRGIATSSNAFMQMLGSTIGVTILGNILTGRLHSQLKLLPEAIRANFPGVDPLNVTTLLLNPLTRAALPDDILQRLVATLYTAQKGVFWAILGTALIGAAIVWLIPSGIPSREASEQ